MFPFQKDQNQARILLECEYLILGDALIPCSDLNRFPRHDTSYAYLTKNHRMGLFRKKPGFLPWNHCVFIIFYQSNFINLIEDDWIGIPKDFPLMSIGNYRRPNILGITLHSGKSYSFWRVFHDSHVWVVELMADPSWGLCEYMTPEAALASCREFGIGRCFSLGQVSMWASQ